MEEILRMEVFHPADHLVRAEQGGLQGEPMLARTFFDVLRMRPTLEGSFSLDLFSLKSLRQESVDPHTPPLHEK